MIELQEDGSEEPNEVAVDRVFRSLDPLYPHHRVQIISVDAEADTLVAVQLSPDGRPWPAHGTFTFYQAHFRWSDAWIPDNTGWPAPYISLGGRLRLKSEVDEELGRQEGDPDEHSESLSPAGDAGRPGA